MAGLHVLKGYPSRTSPQMAKATHSDFHGHLGWVTSPQVSNFSGSLSGKRLQLGPQIPGRRGKRRLDGSTGAFPGLPRTPFWRLKTTGCLGFSGIILKTVKTCILGIL